MAVMLLLVDGTNVMMRYAAAMSPADGTDPDHDKIVSAAAHSIFECAKFAAATHMVVCLDSGVGSWRREKYPEYKANRTSSTHEWSNRLAIHLSSLGVATAREPGYEADDVIATLAARASSIGKAVCILSSDSDLLQLCTLNVSCIQYGQKNEFRFAWRSMAWIRDKYEIATVAHLPAYKALVGEPGDNLPGVPGIGPVKAKKLLAKYSLDGLKAAPEIDPVQFAAMLELTTLREDVPIEVMTLSQCRVNPEWVR